MNYQKVGVNFIETVTDLDAIIASRDSPVLDLHVGRRVGELALRVRPEGKVVKLFFLSAVMNGKTFSDQFDILE